MFVGNPTGVIPASTVSLTGGRVSVPVTFTADNLGIIGNTISLVFTGVETFDQVVNAWNTANPTNTCHHDGIGTYVPYAITLNLAGGADATLITFTAVSGTGFTLVFDGIKTVKQVVDTWNGLNPASQAEYTGRPTSEPGIVPPSIIRLAVGSSNNMFILLQE